jgi:signal transduction histidine kinase/HPt (histidine-containing phosphotransfer) domain-containing protein
LARGDLAASELAIEAAAARPLEDDDEADELEQAILLARTAVLSSNRDPLEAARAALAVAESARARGNPQLEAYAEEIAGSALCRAGEFDRGIEAVGRSLVIFPELDAPRDQSRAMSTLAKCHAGIGQTERAYQLAADALVLRDRAHERMRSDAIAAMESIQALERARADAAAARAERSAATEQLALAQVDRVSTRMALLLALVAILVLLVANRWIRTTARIDRRLAKARAQSFARTSHEIRNPAQAMSGLLHAAARTSDAKRRAILLATAGRAARLIEALAREYRLLGQVDTEGTDPVPRARTARPCDLEALLVETIRIGEFLPEAGGRRIEFSVSNELGGVTAILDPQALSQAALNLLANAFRYAGTGRIRVIARRSAAGELEIVVEDDGPGFDAVDAQTLFAPGFRGSAAAAYPDGEGLGLAITRELVAGLGGSISAGRTDAGGARFTIRLPLSIGAPPAVPAMNLGGLRVLLLDDDEAVRTGLGSSIESLRCAYLSDDGETSIEELLARHDPQVVIIDRYIGSHDGVAVAERIRAHDRALGIRRRLVMLSGMTAGFDSAQEPFDAVATKPFDPDRLPELFGCTRSDGEPAYAVTDTDHSWEPQTAMANQNAPPPRIDTEMVRRLGEIERSRPGFLARLLVSFGHNQRRFVDAIDALVAANDRERLRVGAHTLKGSAASLGAARLAALAGDLEAIAAEGDWAAITEAGERLRAELEPSLAALNEAFSRLVDDLDGAP